MTTRMKNNLVLTSIIMLSFLLGIRNADQAAIVVLSAACILGSVILIIYKRKAPSSTTTEDDAQA